MSNIVEFKEFKEEEVIPEVKEIENIKKFEGIEYVNKFNEKYKNYKNFKILNKNFLVDNQGKNFSESIAEFLRINLDPMLINYIGDSSNTLKDLNYYLEMIDNIKVLPLFTGSKDLYRSKEYSEIEKELKKNNEIKDFKEGPTGMGILGKTVYGNDTRSRNDLKKLFLENLNVSSEIIKQDLLLLKEYSYKTKISEIKQSSEESKKDLELRHEKELNKAKQDLNIFKQSSIEKLTETQKRHEKEKNELEKKIEEEKKKKELSETLLKERDEFLKEANNDLKIANQKIDDSLSNLKLTFEEMSRIKSEKEEEITGLKEYSSTLGAELRTKEDQLKFDRNLQQLYQKAYNMVAIIAAGIGGVYFLVQGIIYVLELLHGLSKKAPDELTKNILINASKNIINKLIKDGSQQIDKLPEKDIIYNKIDEFNEFIKSPRKEFKINPFKRKKINLN